MAPSDEIITPAMAAQAGRYHKLVVRPDCSLAFPGGPRVTMCWLPPQRTRAGSRRLEIVCTEVVVLNRTARSAATPGEAEVKYLDGDFRVVRPGTFVRCAVTGASIPLEELRYWSVDLQEAYATPEAVLQRVGSRYRR